MKLIPKVTFFDFRVPKATCRAEARGCASRQWFLDVSFDPRELKCDFCAQKSLFLTFSTLAPKSHFWAEEWLLGGKVTFELPGLENGSIFRWFLKAWEPSARTVTFDDEETTFANDFMKDTEIFLECLRKHSSKMQKTRPDFRAAQKAFV